MSLAAQAIFISRARAIIDLLLVGRDGEAVTLIEIMDTPDLENLQGIVESLQATIRDELDDRIVEQNLPDALAEADAEAALELI